MLDDFIINYSYDESEESYHTQEEFHELMGISSVGESSGLINQRC